MPLATYLLDDGETRVTFEVEPGSNFVLASGEGHIATEVSAAAKNAVSAAAAVFDQLKAVRPDEIEMTFGIKVSGKANWFVAQAATEANFAVTLKWAQPNNAE